MRIFACVSILIFTAIASTSGVANSQNGIGPDKRFGITEAFWAPSEASDLGIGWERILFYWRELQPTGADDWNTLHVREEWIAQANASGRTIVGLLKNTAPWASVDGTESGLPKGLYLPIDSSENLWAHFVRRVARYYGARNIHHWIIWNEPEIRSDVYGHEFSGTVQDYFRMLKVAYLVIKDEDPQAVIHLAGLTWWHDQGYLGRLLNLIASDPDARRYDYYFDVISLHIYFRSETVARIVEEVNSIQDKIGIDKPIWINETNASPNLDPLWPVERPVFPVDLDQQSWFVVQALSLGFAAGADRISIYKLVDIHLPPGGESFGILRPDMSRRPAFDAYDISIELLSGFNEVSLQQEDTYFVVSFYLPGRLVRVMWSRTEEAAIIALPAASETARLLSVYGDERVVVSPGGYHRIELEGARCQSECIIGGAPFFLVETAYIEASEKVTPAILADQLPPESMATATPTATATNTPIPTVTHTPTSTPLSTATSTPTALLAQSDKPSPTITSNNEFVSDATGREAASPDKSSIQRTENNLGSEWRIRLESGGVWLVAVISSTFMLVFFLMSRIRAKRHLDD